MISNYLGNAILDYVFSGGTLAKPTSIKLKAFTSMPNAAGTGGTEVTGGAYAAVTVTANTTNFPAAADRSKTNGVPITFPQASASWGAVAGLAAYDENDNLLMTAVFAAPRTVGQNDTLSFPAGQVTFTTV